MKLSTLFSHLFILTAIVHGQSDVCIWGRTDETTTFLNGLYVYTVTQTDYVYYAKVDPNCDDNTLYLYVKAGKWSIGQTVDGSTLIASCSSDTHSADPADCDEWEVW